MRSMEYKRHWKTGRASEIAFFIFLYMIAGILLLVLLYDIYTGNINTGGTLSHQIYIGIAGIGTYNVENIKRRWRNKINNGKNE